MTALTQQTVLAHFSLRGANWPDRVAATAAAGFTGVGLYIGEYVRLRESGWTDERLQYVLDAHEMSVIELEAMRFFTGSEDVWDHVVRTFRPARLQVVPPFDGDCDRPAAAQWLRETADRFAPHGVRLAIEFLGCSPIDSPAEAVALAEAAERSNIGLCVDSWHVMRGRGLAGLNGLDAAWVAAIQINDGPLKPTLPDYIPDCLHYRQPLGEGQFPLREFLAKLPDDAPLSVEVISDELDLLPTPVVADRLYRSLVGTVAG